MQIQRSPFCLARLADCAEPDTATSPGAHFLIGVANAVTEYGELDDDTAHEIADAAVPVYTHERWQVFTDLAAYLEDLSDFDSAVTLTDAAGFALYQIAYRLADTLGRKGC